MMLNKLQKSDSVCRLYLVIIMGSEKTDPLTEGSLLTRISLKAQR